jgi:hypothetical protein
MPRSGINLSGRESFALACVEMKNPRTFHFLYVLEDLDNLGDIISVEGSEISYIQPLEYILLTRDKRFKRIVEPQKLTFAFVFYEAPFLEQIVRIEAQPVIAGRCRHFRKIPMKRTDIIVNRHIIVVQNNKKIVGTQRRIVDTFERYAVAYGCVSYQSHRLTVFLSGGVHIRYSHAESSRNGVSRMSAYKRIIFTLKRKRKTAYAVFLPLVCK